ncbi:hypothetical protein [Streptomyces sp. NPDC005780]|uniref:hypothetical protein n=1 Tax=Streptomyces sp. NPDC005780 TaxID=3364730 RepID=UPI0036869B17
MAESPTLETPVTGGFSGAARQDPSRNEDVRRGRARRAGAGGEVESEMGALST